MVNIVEGLNYLVIGNPVSQGFISAAGSIAKSSGLIANKQVNGTKINNKVIMSNIPLWRIIGQDIWLVRLAGLSGAAAVILGAYGSHRTYDEDKGQSRSIFETANRFHFFHSIALVGIPLCRRPLLTGALMAFGTALFTGPCYYRAFSGKKDFSTLAPYGGFCLILAWLSMLL